MSLVTDFLHAVPDLAARLLAGDQASVEADIQAALAPMPSSDQIELVRQVVHPPRGALERPHPRLIQAVLRSVEFENLIQVVIQHNDRIVLGCVALSPEDAQQMASAILMASPSRPELAQDLAQRYPSETLAMLVVGHWAFGDRLPPPLRGTLEQWLIRTDDAEARFIAQLADLAGEYKAVGENRGIFQILSTARAQLPYLEPAMAALWEEEFAGHLLGAELADEAFKRLTTQQGAADRPWSAYRQNQVIGQRVNRPDVHQLAIDALEVMGQEIEHRWTGLSVNPFEGARDPAEFRQHMAQAIVHILDREQIGEPWRTVWRCPGPLQAVLIATERQHQLNARPATASPRSQRRRS